VNRLSRGDTLALAFIILVLGLLLFWPKSGPHGHSRKAAFLRTAKDLEQALKSFHAEYKRFPDISDSGADFSGPTPPELITALIAVSGHEATERLNPRDEQYFSTKMAKKSGGFGVVKTPDGALQLQDWWGQPFHLFLDLNEDGKVRIPDQKGRFQIVKRKVVVISSGPDRKIGTKDDIKSR
jgi:hypothetical protein